MTNKQTKSQGFGDEVEQIAKKLGLDRIADRVAKAVGKKDCGCGARKEALNNPDLLVNKVFYKNNENNEPK